MKPVAILKLFTCIFLSSLSCIAQVNPDKQLVQFNFNWPKPSAAYLDTFNRILKNQNYIFGNNFYGDQEVTLSPAIRGYGIHAWFPENRPNGKAYKECACGRISKFSQYIFNDPIGDWDDRDVNFRILKSPLNSKLIEIGPPSSRIRNSIDVEVDLIKKLKVPTSDGFEELEDITGDPNETGSMGLEVDVAPIVKEYLLPGENQNEFGEFKRFPANVCVYGPWVRDILHPLGHGRAEIHPVEQFWWRPRISGADGKFGAFHLGLLNDRTGRFTYGGSKALHKIPLEGVFAIGFEVNKNGAPLSFSVGPEIINHAKSDYTDGKNHYLITRAGDTLVTVKEINIGIEDYYNVTFERITEDENGMIRGFVVIRSASGLPMKTSEFVEKHSIDLTRLRRSIADLNSLDLYKYEVDAKMKFEGCLYGVGALLSADSLRFAGAIISTVQKFALQKVTMELNIVSVKRLQNNSYRGTSTLNGRQVILTDPSPVPRTYNEKSVRINLRVGTISKHVFISSLQKNELKTLSDVKVIWKGLVSENPKFFIDCLQLDSDDPYNPNLGKIVLTGDPLTSTQGSLRTVLYYERNPSARRIPNNDAEAESETGPPSEVNVFEIVYRLRVLPEAIIKSGN